MNALCLYMPPAGRGFAPAPQQGAANANASGGQGAALHLQGGKRPLDPRVFETFLA
ncbi:MAG: hypothetical protein RR317_03170 [Bilophila sp.]